MALLFTYCIIDVFPHIPSPITATCATRFLPNCFGGGKFKVVMAGVVTSDPATQSTLGLLILAGAAPILDSALAFAKIAGIKSQNCGRVVFLRIC